MEFEDRGVLDIKSEMLEAAKYAEIDVTFTMNLEFSQVIMKLSPKNQRFDLHTEHYESITMPFLRGHSFEEHVVKLMKRLWKDSGRNFYSYFADIYVEYQKLKSKTDE